MRPHLWRAFLLILCLFSGVAGSSAQEPPKDSLALSLVNARAGEVVQVPVRLTDVIGSALGADAGAGNQIQAFALQISWDHPDLVSDVTISRSGSAAGITPLYEAHANTDRMAGCLATFDEQSDPIPGLASGGAEIARLTLIVSPLAKVNTYINLSFVNDGTLLSNQFGTWTERVSNSALSLISGAVIVQKGAALPVVKIKALKSTISGSSAAQTRMRFSLLSKAKKDLKVRFTVSGTAKAGKDYRKLPASIIIKAGRAYADLVLASLRNKSRKSKRTVIFSLKSASSYFVAPPGKATITIK